VTTLSWPAWSWWANVLGMKPRTLKDGRSSRTKHDISPEEAERRLDSEAMQDLDVVLRRHKMRFVVVSAAYKKRIRRKVLREVHECSYQPSHITLEGVHDETMLKSALDKLAQRLRTYGMNVRVEVHNLYIERLDVDYTIYKLIKQPA
jgi:hypothetical protein